LNVKIRIRVRKANTIPKWGNKALGGLFFRISNIEQGILNVEVLNVEFSAMQEYLHSAFTFIIHIQIQILS
jgi:hypothetical protein